MLPTDRAILKSATSTAGELSHRKAQHIRQMGYRIPGSSGDYAPYFLADCLAADRFGNAALNDRWTAGDRDANPLARQRAKDHIEWTTAVSAALKRLSTHDADWHAFIDELADTGKVRLYLLDVAAELREVA
jgi:hypothetical protein